MQIDNYLGLFQDRGRCTHGRGTQSFSPQRKIRPLHHRFGKMVTRDRFDWVGRGLLDHTNEPPTSLLESWFHPGDCSSGGGPRRSAENNSVTSLEFICALVRLHPAVTLPHEIELLVGTQSTTRCMSSRPLRPPLNPALSSVRSDLQYSKRDALPYPQRDLSCNNMGKTPLTPLTTLEALKQFVATSA